MRASKVGDYWRQLAKVQWFNNREFTFQGDDPPLPNVVLRHPVTIVAGLNGSNKTRLLIAIEKQLADDGRLIQLHALSDWMRRILSSRPDFSNLKEETEPLALSEDDEIAIREVVRRNYTSISWYAFPVIDTSPEDPSPFTDLAGEDVLPYFEVEHGGVRYGAEDMGLGELSIHILLWLLWYMREFDGVILLDEPDSFIPESSSRSLLHQILRLSSARKQSFVVTSHGHELISQGVSQDEVVLFLAHDGEKVVCYDDPVDVREFAKSLLAVSTVDRLVLLVEDDAAAALSREMLRQLDANLARQSTVLWAGGTGILQSLQANLPGVSGRGMDVVVVLDGEITDLPADHSNRTHGGQPRWPYVILPGGTEPDVLMQEGTLERVPFLADLLRVSNARLTGVLSKIEGTEHHTWIESMVTELGDIDRQIVLEALAIHLMAGSRGQELREQFREALARTGLSSVAFLS
jgi:hypothetical protein